MGVRIDNILLYFAPNLLQDLSLGRDRHTYHSCTRNGYMISIRCV